MALINRVSRLFTADVHAVLDRIEEPEALLRHAIREMEEEVAAAELHGAELEREIGALAERERKLAATLAELAGKLDVAFGSGNEDLARRLLRRKLETEKLGRHTADRRESLAQTRAELEQELALQRERLDVLRQKADLFAPRSTEPTVDDWSQRDLAVGDDELEIAFLSERQRRGRA
jgi:phage shock protein A